jgi:hypothetical protein
MHKHCANYFFLLYKMSKQNINLIPDSHSQLCCCWAFASHAQRLDRDRHKGGEGGKEMGQENVQHQGPAAALSLLPGAGAGAGAVAAAMCMAEALAAPSQ